MSRSKLPVVKKKSVFYVCMNKLHYTTLPYRSKVRHVAALLFLLQSQILHTHTSKLSLDKTTSECGVLL